MRNITFAMKKVELKEEKINDFTKDFVGVNFEATAFGFQKVNPIDLTSEERAAAHKYIMDFVMSEDCPEKDRFELFCEAEAILEGKKKIGMLFRPKLASIFPFDEEVIRQYSKYKEKAVLLDIFSNYDNYPSIL